MLLQLIVKSTASLGLSMMCSDFQYQIVVSLVSKDFSVFALSQECFRFDILECVWMYAHLGKYPFVCKHYSFSHHLYYAFSHHMLCILHIVLGHFCFDYAARYLSPQDSLLLFLNFIPQCWAILNLLPLAEFCESKVTFFCLFKQQMSICVIVIKLNSPR
jgi:hypothetical protein